MADNNVRNVPFFIRRRPPVNILRVAYNSKRRPSLRIGFNNSAEPVVMLTAVVMLPDAEQLNLQVLRRKEKEANRTERKKTGGKEYNGVAADHPLVTLVSCLLSVYIVRELFTRGHT